MNPFHHLGSKALAIVAGGESNREFVHASFGHGGVRHMFDQVWTVNAMGPVIHHDILFMMDDLSVVMDPDTSEPVHKVFQDWLPQHTKPIFSTVPHPRVPMSRRYPLEEVIAANGGAFPYLNNTVPYMLAFALATRRFGGIALFGLDYTYPDDPHYSEAGRGCCEYWIGRAMERNIRIHVAGSSTLMDARYGMPLYGWEPCPPPDRGPIITQAERYHRRLDTSPALTDDLALNLDYLLENRANG